MAKRPTLTDLTSLTNSSGVNAINTNWDAIQEAFDNTLSRDGSTPNTMTADLDLNGNALLNVGTIAAENLTLDGQTITDVSAIPEWRGAWLTATSYAKRDMVKQAGNVYICLVAHTSGTFSTDLTALRWELMVSKGDSGAGTGDLLSTNNLSDLANAATARSNLGLGTVAVENTVPIAKGGTGATTSTDARTNLGLGSLATLSTITTSNIASATLVTEADSIASNDNDTTIPTSAAVKAYADSAGGRVLLASKTASSSATLDFPEFNNATYRYYEFILENVKPAVDNDVLAIRFSTNGGTSYDSGATDYAWAAQGYSPAGAANLGSAADGGIAVGTNGVGNAAGEYGVSGSVLVLGAGNASVSTRAVCQTGYDNTLSQAVTSHSSGRRITAQDTDGVRFYYALGNIASGTIRMYGYT